MPLAPPVTIAVFPASLDKTILPSCPRLSPQVGFTCGTFYMNWRNSGRPELRMPSTSLLFQSCKTWMPATSAGMTLQQGEIRGTQHRRPPGDPDVDRELGTLARCSHVGSLPHRLAQGRADVGNLVSGVLRRIHPGQSGRIRPGRAH